MLTKWLNGIYLNGPLDSRLSTFDSCPSTLDSWPLTLDPWLSTLDLWPLTFDLWQCKASVPLAGKEKHTFFGTKQHPIMLIPAKNHPLRCFFCLIFCINQKKAVPLRLKTMPIMSIYGSADGIIGPFIVKNWADWVMIWVRRPRVFLAFWGCYRWSRSS